MSLKLVDINIQVGNKILFKNFNLEVASGTFCTLMGPSGSGKSSLFNFILGTLNSKTFTYTGEIFLNGVRLTSIPIAKRQIGILFQDPYLFPNLNVMENLAFGLKENLGTSTKNIRKEKMKIIAQNLEKAQLPGLENQNPETLSGGEKTRVGLLRTLLADPKALLLDEPFSKLDRKLRNEFRDWVFTILREKSIPVLLVTHDPADIPQGCEQVIEMPDVR